MEVFPEEPQRIKFCYFTTYYFWLRIPLVLGRNDPKKYGDLKYAPVLY